MTYLKEFLYKNNLRIDYEKHPPNLYELCIRTNTDHNIIFGNNDCMLHTANSNNNISELFENLYEKLTKSDRLELRHVTNNELMTTYIEVPENLKCSSEFKFTLYLRGL